MKVVLILLALVVASFSTVARAEESDKISGLGIQIKSEWLVPGRQLKLTPPSCICESHLQKRVSQQFWLKSKQGGIAISGSAPKAFYRIIGDPVWETTDAGRYVFWIGLRIPLD